MGSHVDFQDGLVLPMALAQETRVGVKSTGGPRVRLKSDRFDGSVDVAADGSDGPDGGISGWGRYAAAVVWALARRGRPPAGLEGVVTSTVPPRAGLSSSAALEVAIAHALMKSASWALPALDVARACWEAEVEGAGVPVGIMDPAVSCLGSPRGALLIDCKSLSIRDVGIPGHLRVVVIDSGAQRVLADGRYASRRADVEAGVRRLGIASLREAALDAVVSLPDPERRRCRHVVTEIARVAAFADALTSDDTAVMGETMRASYRSDVEDYEAGHPQVDALVARLEGWAGVVGARMSGGGFGGVVVALVEADRAAAIVDDVAPLLAFVAQPSPGAGVVVTG